MKVRGVTSLSARESNLSPVTSQEVGGKTSSLPLSSLFPLSAIPRHAGNTLLSGTLLFVNGGVEGGAYLAIKVTDVIIQGLMGEAVTSVSKAGKAPS